MFVFAFLKKHSNYPFGYELLTVKKRGSHHLFAVITRFLGSREFMLFRTVHVIALFSEQCNYMNSVY